RPCAFFLQGICRYGPYCRNSHATPDQQQQQQTPAECPNCGQDLGLQTPTHVKECDAKFAQTERDHSADLECGICFERIVEAGRRFGVLPECTHPFCLPCIRSWRASSSSTSSSSSSSSSTSTTSSSSALSLTGGDGMPPLGSSSGSASGSSSPSLPVPAAA